MRLSSYIFDEEGCVYPDKTARKTPLDANKLRATFKPNPTITNPILIDNKEERKREETRPHKKPRYKGGFPKEIKMGQVLMPPYYWHKIGENSTLDSRQSGLVEEITHTQTPITSTQIHRQRNSSTLDSRRSELVEERATTQHTNSRHVIIMDQRTTDPRHQGLVGNKSHADINALMMINQDRRSILINDDEPNQKRIPIDDNLYKRRTINKFLKYIHQYTQR